MDLSCRERGGGRCGPIPSMPGRTKPLPVRSTGGSPDPRLASPGSFRTWSSGVLGRYGDPSGRVEHLDRPQHTLGELAGPFGRTAWPAGHLEAFGGIGQRKPVGLADAGQRAPGGPGVLRPELLAHPVSIRSYGKFHSIPRPAAGPKGKASAFGEFLGRRVAAACVDPAGPGGQCVFAGGPTECGRLVGRADPKTIVALP